MPCNLAACFCPFHWPVLAYISLAVLLGITLSSTVKQALWRGLVFGIGYFGVGVSWVFISVNTFGNTPLFISLVITAMFVGYLALFPMLQAVSVAGLCKWLPKPAIALLVFPLSWVVFEWIRGTLFTGFPWLFVGYSQIDTPLRNFAPFIRVYGLSFPRCIFAGALVLLASHPKTRWKIISAASIFVLIISGWLLKPVIAARTTPLKPIKVALIQGNIPNVKKWNPAFFLSILSTYKTLTEQHWGSKLIIWPEGAIPCLCL